MHNHLDYVLFSANLHQLNFKTGTHLNRCQDPPHPISSHVLEHHQNNDLVWTLIFEHFVDTCLFHNRLTTHILSV
jgi:hypothetical protein